MSKITETAQGNLIVENAEIIFRNFEGKEKEFNSAGDRNFCLVLSPEQADAMAQKGWNVKRFKVRDEGEEPNGYIEVAVEYRKGRPPRCVMINSQGRIDLGAEEIQIFDYADFSKVDLIINPYNWDVGGKQGIKAYLKSIFVTINEDELEQMYANVPEANQRPAAEPVDHDLFNE